MAHIRYANANDAAAARAICETAFSLTVNDVDSRFPAKGGAYLYRYYAKKAFEEHPAHCLVAEESGRVAGFVIFGVDLDTGKRVGERMGNIILLAVEPAHQGKGIGTALVDRVLAHFRDHDFTFASVGTDLDNTAALSVYERTGFAFRFAWATYRRYAAERTKENEAPAATLTETTDRANTLSQIELTRTHSFFYDERLPVEPVREKHREYLAGDTSLAMYDAAMNGSFLGMVTMRTDPWLSEASGMTVRRIEDIIPAPRFAENALAITHLVRAAAATAQGDMVEMWVPLRKHALVNALTAEGFSFVHSACVLHRYFHKREGKRG